MLSDGFRGFELQKLLNYQTTKSVLHAATYAWRRYIRQWGQRCFTPMTTPALQENLYLHTLAYHL